MIDAITREEVKSCHALKKAWMKNTTIKTTPRAALAAAGGFPRGRHATKQRTPPTSNKLPKPPKQYMKILCARRDGGGLWTFRPYQDVARVTCVGERPPVTDVCRFSHRSAGERTCHFKSRSSILFLGTQLFQVGYKTRTFRNLIGIVLDLRGLLSVRLIFDLDGADLNQSVVSIYSSEYKV